MDKSWVSQVEKSLKGLKAHMRLLDEQGNCIVPQGLPAMPVPLSVLEADSFVIEGGCTFCRVEAVPSLTVCVEGEDAAAQDIALLASAMVAANFYSGGANVDSDNAYRRALREDADITELEVLAQEHHIEWERERCCMLLYFASGETSTIAPIIEESVPWVQGDAVVELDRHTIVLVKCLDEPNVYEELQQSADALCSTLLTETGEQVSIGLGDGKRSFFHIGESYREARRAIEIGRIFQKPTNVYVYKRLLLERFLADIPREMGTRYYSMMFNRKTSRLFSDEMIHTIQKFFENNLNLSETARQLYIHRNTLVYRLDKIQRMIGLDLRAFDDAVTFKMMLLLGRSGSDRPRAL